ncbi:MAG: small multi-drug export protein [Pseudomonadota bacterium]
MWKHLFWMVVLTFLPTLELRASIPYGYYFLSQQGQLAWIWVALLCIGANFALAPLVWFFVHHVMHFFLRVAFIKRFYDWLVLRAQRKVEPYVRRYGTVGLAIFIGVPLPGSGVYTGCLGAYLLGYRFRDYMWASLLGVFIAGAIVTALVVSGTEAFLFFKDPTGLPG